MPTCWIIAGPNGAGKTTFALSYSYLRLVSQLRAAAWRVELIYLALPDRTLSHQRVAERVSHGGHDIPAADIERRFARSLHHLFQDFSASVDTCRCYMNRGPTPELVFEQTGPHRVVHHAAYYEQMLSQVRK